MLAQRAVQHEGQVVGYVRSEWRQTEPNTYVLRWVIDAERLDFDEYEEAVAYLMERHAKGLIDGS